MAFYKQHAKQARKLDQALKHIQSRDYLAALKLIAPATGENPGNRYSRYVAGFALLKTGQPLATLAQWWPLVRDGTHDFVADCRFLAESVFSPETWDRSQWQSLPLTSLEELLAAALYFSINTKAVHQLEQHVSSLLWQQKQWIRLLRLTNVDTRYTPDKLHLRGKIVFAQGCKSELKPFAFASSIMSAGATYLTIYRDWKKEDLDELLTGLARETFLSCPIHASGVRKKEEQLSLWLYLDLERRALKEILTSFNPNWPELVLSPGLFYSHDIPEDSRSRFLDRIMNTAAAAELKALFRRDVFVILQSACHGQFDIAANLIREFPFLRILEVAGAVSKEMEQGSDKDHDAPLELETLPDSSTLIGHFGIQICKAVLYAKSDTSFTFRKSWLPGRALQLAAHLARTVKDRPFSRIIFHLALERAARKATFDEPWMEELAYVATLTGEPEHIQKLRAIAERQRECEDLLQALAGKRISKAFDMSKILNDETSFRDHFYLLAHARILTPPDSYARKKLRHSLVRKIVDWESSLAVPYMLHVYKLLKNSSHLRIPGLEFHRARAERCDCEQCQEALYESLPEIAEQMGCPPLIPIQSESHFLQNLKRELDLSWEPSRSLFEQEDPFARLMVSPHDPKPMVLASVMRLMKESTQHIVQLRKAQAEAFRPEVRFLYGFLKDPRLPSLISSDADKNGASSSGGSSRRPPRDIPLRPKEAIQ
ncbi:MAG: hypothetical protein AB7G93_12065 [Bdellovibrionales bacterium]